MNWETLTEKEKEILSTNAFGELINNLEGENNLYKIIILEETLKFLLGEEDNE